MDSCFGKIASGALWGKTAMTIGLVLVVPCAWIEFSGRYGTWWVQGLALVVGATGLSIFWTGMTGPSPDWVDANDQRPTTTLPP